MEKTAQEPSAVAFVRRHKMHFFGGLCSIGDVILALRGAFNHDANIHRSGYEMTAGAVNTAFGGPKSISAIALTTAGIENLISGVRDVSTGPLNWQNGLQVGFGVAWTVAPAVLFYGDKIASGLKSAFNSVSEISKKFRLSPQAASPHSFAPPSQHGKWDMSRSVL